MTWLIRLYCCSRGQRSRSKGKRDADLSRGYVCILLIFALMCINFFSHALANEKCRFLDNMKWRLEDDYLHNRFICKLLTENLRQDTTISRFTSRRISRTGWTAFVACPTYLTRERGELPTFCTCAYCRVSRARHFFERDASRRMQRFAK